MFQIIFIICSIFQQEMQKSDIRKMYKEKRLRLSVAQRAKMDDLMLIQFQKLLVNIPALIMTYAPIKKLRELDPQYITYYYYFKNTDQQLVYPVMTTHNDSCEMCAVMVENDSFFETNPYSIDKPVDGHKMRTADIEMFFVPLLSFDKNGNLVGYSKGYYGRFLKQCSTNSIKIGFSYFDAVENIEDIDKHDIKLDYCITPESIFTF